MTQGEYLNLTLGIVMFCLLVIDLVGLLWANSDGIDRSLKGWTLFGLMVSLTLLTWYAIYLRLGVPKQ